ncbi:GNAT family N-acetyltransferase [Ferrimonas marina]|uniref:Putative acetyltransferase n=1 Tax=Ferrimonas marina TaxID=299255 RepID=A0A1M5P4Y5_9GAMM|nr:N-acetyltransferase [Ferrimonas marina]SHG96812.1 putative acetyltransferase [Ferrimonas marina]
MDIRPETLADEAHIRSLVYNAFKGHPYHPPGAEPTEHLAIDRLRHGHELRLSLVAELDGRIVGHIAFSPVTINGHEHAWWGLAPLSVAPEWQGKGIGTALAKAGMAKAEGSGIAGVVVLGDPNYYQRFGFRHYDGLHYPDVPPEYFLACRFGEATPSGAVHYSKAFGS